MTCSFIFYGLIVFWIIRNIRAAKTPPAWDISIGVAKYFETKLKLSDLRSNCHNDKQLGFEFSNKYLKRLFPISVIWIHSVSLSYTFIIPDAEASDRGFKTHGGETLSAKVLMSWSLNKEQKQGWKYHNFSLSCASLRWVLALLDKLLFYIIYTLVYAFAVCLRLLFTFTFGYVRFTLLRYIWLFTFVLRWLLVTFGYVCIRLRWLRCCYVYVVCLLLYGLFVVTLRFTLLFVYVLRYGSVYVYVYVTFVYGCVCLRLRWFSFPRYRLFALVRCLLRFTFVFVCYVTLRLRLRLFTFVTLLRLLLRLFVVVTTFGWFIAVGSFVYVCLLRSLFVYRSLRSTFVVGYVRLVRLVGLLVGFVG
jgi:hypothetical protein